MRLAMMDERRRRNAVLKAISALAKGSEGHSGHRGRWAHPFCLFFGFVYCHLGKVHAKEAAVHVAMSCRCARVTWGGPFGCWR
jgi:hypothetical protein